MMIKDLFNIFVLAMVFLGIFGGIMLASSHTVKVHIHPSDRASYLQGEMCVISMEEQDNNILELNDRYIWCQMKHDEFLKTKR